MLYIKEDLTQEEYLHLFEYRDGKLFWRNPIYSKGITGKKSDIKGGRGYFHVKIRGQIYTSGRVVYIMHNGPIPEGMEVDHKDEDKTNNRIDNLTLLTHAQNIKKSCHSR